MIDLDVGYDGTWMTRGHKSHISIGFVIEADTRVVVDFEVLCNYCTICAAHKKKFPGSLDDYLTKHKC